MKDLTNIFKQLYDLDAITWKWAVFRETYDKLSLFSSSKRTQKHKMEQERNHNKAEASSMKSGISMSSQFI